jgi:hypothetical protein
MYALAFTIISDLQRFPLTLRPNLCSSYVALEPKPLSRAFGLLLEVNLANKKKCFNDQDRAVVDDKHILLGGKGKKRERLTLLLAMTVQTRSRPGTENCSN